MPDLSLLGPLRMVSLPMKPKVHPPHWYQDPLSPHQDRCRWWDGSKWTVHTALWSSVRFSKIPTKVTVLRYAPLSLVLLFPLVKVFGNGPVDAGSLVMLLMAVFMTAVFPVGFVSWYLSRYRPARAMLKAEASTDYLASLKISDAPAPTSRPTAGWYNIPQRGPLFYWGSPNLVETYSEDGTQSFLPVPTESWYRMTSNGRVALDPASGYVRWGSMYYKEVEKDLPSSWGNAKAVASGGHRVVNLIQWVVAVLFFTGLSIYATTKLGMW